jgi:alanyl-tRNA synthetase
LPVSWKEENTKEAFAKGASGAFGDKYGDTVKVYTIGDPKNRSAAKSAAARMLSTPG